MASASARILEKALRDAGKTPHHKEPLKPLTIVTREEWDAKRPVGDVPVFRYKPNIITFTFDTGSDKCTTREECIRVVQGIQEKNIAEGQPDIDYNFLIGGDGNVYEGRGWTKRVSFSRKNPPTENPLQTFDIGVIGEYSACRWGFEMHVMYKALDLVSYGVKKKMIEASYTFAT